MKLLVLTTSYPRSADDPGGHFVATCASELARAGHEVAVLAPGRARCVERRDGVEVRWLGGAAAFGWPGAAQRLRSRPLAATLDLARIVPRVLAAMDGADHERFDEVHAHWLVPCAWPLARMLVRRAADAAGGSTAGGCGGERGGPRVVGYAHGGDVRLLTSLPPLLLRWIIDDLLASVDRVRFAAASLQGELLARLDRARARALRDRSEIALPALSLPPTRRDRAETRAPLGVAERDPLAVTLGRLVASKRFDLAIRAAARSRMQLAVIGDGPERARLEALARELGARVIFTGALPRPRALELLAAATVLVHPSAAEAAPTAIREARALGIPVIACAAGDIADWAQHDRGIHCVSADPAAIARALVRSTAP